MRGIARDERAAVAEFVRDEATAVPVFLRDHLVFEIRIDPEDGAQAAIAIDRLEIILVGPKIIMHQPALGAVDRIDHPGAARIDRAGAPGALVLLAIEQARRTDESRLHTLDDGIAGKFGADRLAHDRARTVATDQEAAIDAPDRTRVEIAQGNAGTIILDHHVLRRGAVDDGDARLRGRMLEQDRLKEYLVDAMRRLRRRPVAIGDIGRGEAIAAAGNFDPRQLLPGKGSAVADVVRIIRRQSGIADLVGNAEPAENLHGARGDMVAFRFRRSGAGARLHNRHIDAAPGEIDRKRQADRSGAYNQNRRLHHSASAPELLTIVAQRSTSVLM